MNSLQWEYMIKNAKKWTFFQIDEEMINNGKEWQDMKPPIYPQKIKLHAALASWIQNG